MTLIPRALLLASCLVQTDPASVLTIRAWANTAGPYGESWTLTVPSSGDVSLEILYHLNPMGKLSGEFCVGDDRLAPIKQALRSERFMELPGNLEPDVSHFHRPTLRLQVSLGESQHQVEVYDPDALGDDAELLRFRAVWDRVLELVPLEPEW